MAVALALGMPFRRSALVLTALVCSSGCEPSEVPPDETFAPEEPFPTYHATGGWVLGEWDDGTAIEATADEVHSGVSRRYPVCGTQTMHVSMQTRSHGRDLLLTADLRFFEEDGLAAGAPLETGEFWNWGIHYRDPPPGGALIQLGAQGHPDFFGARVDTFDAQATMVCGSPDGRCQLRLVIDADITFRGANERAGEVQEASVTAALDLAPEVVRLDEDWGGVIFGEPCGR
jgi:hypothetical protein